MKYDEIRLKIGLKPSKIAQKPLKSLLNSLFWPLLSRGWTQEHEEPRFAVATGRLLTLEDDGGRCRATGDDEMTVGTCQKGWVGAKTLWKSMGNVAVFGISFQEAMVSDVFWLDCQVPSAVLGV